MCCEISNAALDERKSAYRMAGVSLSYQHQCAELPECKEVRPELSQVPSQVLQDVVKRVDLAFDAFFQRVEHGQKPGYPRFKARLRYDSLTFKQHGNRFQLLPRSQKNRARLVLAKLGQMLRPCMSGSGIDGKTFLSKRFANSSNGSDCSQ